jgi:hypothetical protein
MGLLHQAMLIENPDNERILSYLAQRSPGSPAFAPISSVQDCYYGCGSHPDVVERLWDQLGKALPSDCRCLIHRTPALAHPKSGIVFAAAVGTQYILRLPDSVEIAALSQNAKSFTVWSNGQKTDLVQEIGPHWIFGAWLKDEPAWCRSTYDQFSAES